MGNTCNHQTKAGHALAEHAEYGFVQQPYFPPHLGPEPEAEKYYPYPPPLLLKSCMTVDQLESLTENTLSDMTRMPNCLLPGDVDSDGSDELDFSKDMDLHEKRAPAVAGQELSPERLGMIASPARKSDRRVDKGPTIILPSASTQSFIMRKGGVSGYRRPMTPTTQKMPAQRRTSGRVPCASPQRPMRCDSSLVVSQPSQRCNSSYVTATLPHCRSSYILPSNAIREATPKPQRPGNDLVEEIRLDSLASGMPCVQELLRHIRPKLGISELARIETVNGFSGGQNKGTWVLRDGRRCLVLKLVEGQRKHPNMPTEAEVFGTLLREHPQIRSDPSLAFPFKVFYFRDSCGSRRYDLIVMKKAPGVPMGEVISTKVGFQQTGQLMPILESLGRFLAGVHKRYNLQHGDFQPSNIFYDEATGNFTLIDVGGMDGMPCQKDVEHFGESLNMLANGLQKPMLSTDGVRHFRNGYHGTGQSRGVVIK